MKCSICNTAALAYVVTLQCHRCLYCGAVQELDVPEPEPLTAAFFDGTPFENRPLSREETGQPFRHDPRNRP